MISLTFSPLRYVRNVRRNKLIYFTLPLKKKESMNLENYYTMKQAAEVMGCTYQTFSRWAWTDGGPTLPAATKVGSNKFYRKVEIHQCLKGHDPERYCELFPDHRPDQDAIA